MIVTHRRRLKRAIGWIVTTIAVAFFIQRIVANAAHLPQVTWNATAITVSAGSVSLALLAISLSGVAWQTLLRDQRIDQPTGDVLALFMVSQFGKYLPGNVGQFVGRVVLARDLGIPMPITLATMLTEVLWGVGTALGVSALSLYLFLGNAVTPLPAWLNAAGLAACFMGLLAAPWVGITLLRRWLPGLVNRIFAGSELRPPGLKAALGVSALFAGTYLSMGLILALQARVLFNAPVVSLLEVSGFFAIAWLAGYLLPGAPAGLGVRESLLLLLFSPLYGESTALALGITLRLASTLADALALGIGWYWRFARRSSDREEKGNHIDGR